MPQQGVHVLADAHRPYYGPAHFNYGPAPPRAGLAQLVEHLICNQGVTGSNPVAGTILFNGLEGIALPCYFSSHQ